MLEPSSFWKETPSQNRLYPCPACNETISADASNCRFCNLPIDANTAERLLTDSQQVVTAVAQANTFNLSTTAAVLLAGFAFFNLYMDRSLIVSLVVCSVVAFGYGAWWLRRNRSRVTQDVDYPSAVTKVKRTMIVWAAVLLAQLAGYLMLNGLPVWRRSVVELPEPVVRTIIAEEKDRPVLSIASVKADHLIPVREDNRWNSPLLRIHFRNDGNTSARLTGAAVKSYLPSGDCDLRFADKPADEHRNSSRPCG